MRAVQVVALIILAWGAVIVHSTLPINLVGVWATSLNRYWAILAFLNFLTRLMQDLMRVWAFVSTVSHAFLCVLCDFLDLLAGESSVVIFLLECGCFARFDQGVQHARSGTSGLHHRHT